MHDNWAEVRRQLEQVLESERAQRQARRRRQPSFWQLLRQWWLPALELAGGNASHQPAARPSHTPALNKGKDK